VTPVLKAGVQSVSRGHHTKACGILAHSQFLNEDNRSIDQAG
jgi:hypothetical protein